MLRFQTCTCPNMSEGPFPPSTDSLKFSYLEVGSRGQVSTAQYKEALVTTPQHTYVSTDRGRQQRRWAREPARGGSVLTQELLRLQALCLLADLCQSLDHTLPDTVVSSPQQGEWGREGSISAERGVRTALLLLLGSGRVCWVHDAHGN